MKIAIETAIKSLSVKAEKAAQPHEAMNLAQAALNLAHTKATWSNAEKHNVEPTFDTEALAWAYNKCVSLGLEKSSIESAMMMDRIKMMLGGY